MTDDASPLSIASSTASVEAPAAAASSSTGKVRPIAAAVTRMRSAPWGKRERRRPTRSDMPIGRESEVGMVHVHAVPSNVNTPSSAIVRRSCMTRNGLPSVCRNTNETSSSPRSLRCSVAWSHCRSSGSVRRFNRISRTRSSRDSLCRRSRTTPYAASSLRSVIVTQIRSPSSCESK